MTYVSKNKAIAREEWKKNQEVLKQGKLPSSSYKAIVKKEPKYTANSKFIKDKEAKEAYWGRNYGAPSQYKRVEYMTQEEQEAYE